jgi:Helix-turn-helix domain
MSSETAPANSRIIGKPFNPYGMFTGIWIPTALVRLRTLSPGAKICYGRLARYAGEDGLCYVSVNTLAGEIGVGERQTQKYLHELERERFIRKVVQLGSTNRIVFLWHEVFTDNDRGCTIVHPKRVIQESHHQDSHLRNGLSRKLRTSPDKGVRGRRAKSKPVDDDDAAATSVTIDIARALYGSPEEELIALAASKNQVPTGVTVARIADALECHGVSLQRFVETMRPHFQNDIFNPSGFLLDAARTFPSVRAPARTTFITEQPIETCMSCGEPKGRGMVIQENEIRPCPECAGPEFIEEFKRKQADRKARERKN